MKRRHLRRLDQVWIEPPIVFVTACTHHRRRALDTPGFHDICREVWSYCEALYSWNVGRYVLMHDHVHFFCTPRPSSKLLSTFISKWKEWTSKHARDRLGYAVPVWQTEFFDHLLRSEESYQEKWAYVVQNPVRAGLVTQTEDWPFQGEMNVFRVD